VANSHEAIFEIRWDRNRFRLTETIYMKLKHYHFRDNAYSYINHLIKTKCK